MSKDPAMLWYWNDWNSSTVLLSRFLKGCYMDLLHAQFNHGRLSLEEIKTCLGSDFGSSWPAIQKKFKQDKTGLFFNERLEMEKEKRIAFTAGRRENLGKNSHMGKHMAPHMKPHMDNEYVNTGFNWEREKQSFSSGEEWIYKICTSKNLAMLDVKAMMKSFINDIELKEEYKTAKELRSHFVNLLNKNKASLPIKPRKVV